MSIQGNMIGFPIPIPNIVQADGSVPINKSLRFASKDGTQVVTAEVYRDLTDGAAAGSYMTRLVITSDGGASMQLYAGTLGADKLNEVNRITLTKEDTRADKPLNLASGGTGRNLSAAPAGAVFRNASDGTGMYYTPTKSGAFYATDENGTPTFGILPLKQGGVGTNELSGAPNFAIIRKAGDGSNKLYYTATANGAFYATGDNVSAKFGTLPVAQGGTGATDAATARTNLQVAEARPSTAYTDCYYRKVDDVTEWYNPPMVVGTEYRTTGRFKGQPVYVKAVNVGTLPNAASKKVNHGITGMAQLVSAECVVKDSAAGWFSVGYSNSSGATGIYCGATQLTITCHFDGTACTGIAIIQYTKQEG